MSANVAPSVSGLPPGGSNNGVAVDMAKCSVAEKSENLENLERDKLLEPFTYVASMKGKNFRRQLGIGINYWFGVKGETLDKVLEVVDKLHNASLVIDDIEDNSELRRTLPTAHLVYGTPMSINAANYAYFDVLKTVLEFGTIEAAKIYANQMIALHHGQGMELYWRDGHQYKLPTKENNNGNECAKGDANNPTTCATTSSLPTEKEYQDVIVKKTSGLFVLLVDLLRERSGKKSVNVTKLTKLMGLCFQVRDDLMNLTSSEYKETKGFCEDISEGKLSFPVVYALNNRTFSFEKRLRLVTILHMKTTSNALKEEAFEILKESGAIQYTKERLVQLKEEIAQEIKVLGGNPILEQILAKFWG